MTSPFTFACAVDLSTVPPNSRIVAVGAQYSGYNMQDGLAVGDPGGSGSISGSGTLAVDIIWGSGGVAALNAAQQSFSYQATASFVGTGDVWATYFYVCYLPAVT